VVDEESLSKIAGSTVHYSTELIRQAFVVEDNPKAEKGCSCGVSFHSKDDAVLKELMDLKKR